nr:RND family transporter [Methanosarcina siciliae]
MGVFIQSSRPAIIVTLILFVIISLQGAQLIEMASGTETYVSKDTQLYKNYDQLYKKNFETDSIVVMIQGNEVASEAVMKAADKLEQQMLIVPGVLSVTSPATLINQINYQVSGRSKIPDSDRGVQELINSQPSLFETLLPDKTHMMIVIKIAGSSTDQQKEDILNALYPSLNEAGFPPGYSLIVTGSPALRIDIDNEMTQSMGVLLGISSILMVIVLLLVFRHVRWGLLPLPVVLLGVFFTFGFMGYSGVPMTMVSMAAFPVLIGIGIDYAIQFHNRMEEEIRAGNSSKKALILTTKHTAPAVLIALIMTSLGFVSLFTSTVPMIQEFGILLLIGIVMCYLSALFFGLVTLYSFDWVSKKSPLRRFKQKTAESETENPPPNIPSAKVERAKALENALIKSADFTIRHSKIILVVALLTCFAGLYADRSVPIQTDTNSFIPQDMPSLINYKQMMDLLPGSGDHFNIILRVKDNSDPEILKWIDEFSQHEVTNRRHVNGATSIVDLVKEQNGGTIPETSEEIQAIYDEISDSQKQEYMLGSQLLTIDLDIGQAMENIEITGIKELRDIIQEDIQWMQLPPGVSVVITGQSVAMIDIVVALTSGRSLMTMLGVGLVLMGLIVVYRDPIKALSPIIPMFIVVGWSGLIMAGLNIAYTPMTAVLGALILGVGSEYSILMMERYFEEKDNGLDPVSAINQAVTTTGSALIASGATTVFGFSALIFSPFPILSNFGLVTVIDVCLAIFVTFVVFPPLIVMMDTRREKRRAASLAAVAAAV